MGTVSDLTSYSELGVVVAVLGILVRYLMHRDKQHTEAMGKVSDTIQRASDQNAETMRLVTDALGKQDVLLVQNCERIASVQQEVRALAEKTHSQKESA